MITIVIRSSEDWHITGRRSRTIKAGQPIVIGTYESRERAAFVARSWILDPNITEVVIKQG